MKDPKDLEPGDYILFFDEQYYCLEYKEPSRTTGWYVIPSLRHKNMDLCLPHELITVYDKKQVPPLWKLV